MIDLCTNEKLISKGAEAYLYLCNFDGIKAIKKVRIQKKYRIPQLDIFLRKTRTKREAKLLQFSRKVGVPTPIVLDVDLISTSITMEYIEGKLLRTALLYNEMTKEHALALFEKLGTYVGILHENGVIHGDLTTSNIILTPDNLLVLIDFGLGEFCEENEHRGIELRVFWTSLNSVHYRFAHDYMNAFLQGYKKTFTEAERVIRIFKQIRLRGRYIATRRKTQYHIGGYIGE